MVSLSAWKYRATSECCRRRIGGLRLGRDSRAWGQSSPRERSPATLCAELAAPRRLDGRTRSPSLAPADDDLLPGRDQVVEVGAIRSE